MIAPQPTWRLLLDGPGAPDWNMAVDEALLRAGPRGTGLPILRLYTWDPHALSLGANQEGGSAVDWEALERDGYGSVRRPTGGRAILHAQELTYSVTAPAPPGGTLVAYRWLASGLAAGLRAAGVPVDFERVQHTAAAGLRTRHPCFAAAGRYELVASGRKVVGSAQRRRRGWLMQHGSILLGDEHLRLPHYLRGVDPEVSVRELSAATVDCSQLVGRPIDAAGLAPILAEGFAGALGFRLHPSVLTPAERTLAEDLRVRRFGDVGWTRSGTYVAAGQQGG